MKKFLFSIMLLYGTGHQGIAQTGIPNPYMTTCDTYVSTFLSTYNIPGATFAMSKNGKLVYLRAFGTANSTGTEITQPYHKFRIASLSKPITGIAVMKLVEDGIINLTDKVFGATGLLAGDPDMNNISISDSRIYDITVQQLLEHTAGFNRDLNCFPNPTPPYSYRTNGCDPISAPLYVSNVTGTSNPVTKLALMKFLLEKGLDFTPGTAYNYSNIGYLILGKIIEHKTGLSYENYVKTSIFEPLGICDIELAKNLKTAKKEREVAYFGNGYTTLSCYGDNTTVPWEYGGFNIEAMDAHGGWIATAKDLVKLLVAVDNFNTKPDILNATTINTMVTPSTVNNGYAKGWTVNAANNWWHTGALDGTATILARTSNGYTWAILLNKRIIDGTATNFWNALDALPWNCITAATGTATYDLMLDPLTNTSALTTSQVSGNTVTLSWTSGNGSGRIVVASKDNPVSAFPVDGSNYTANDNMGAGDNLGNDNFVVYNGNGNSVTVNNLLPNTTYHFRVFEYNNNAATGNYALYKQCHCAMLEVNTGSLSLNDNDLTKGIKVYPNPVYDKLRIQTGDAAAGSIHIYDAQGRLVLRESIKRISAQADIDVSILVAGTYIVELRNEKDQVTGKRKIVKK